jgi:hypothetical protein
MKIINTNKVELNLGPRFRILRFATPPQMSHLSSNFHPVLDLLDYQFYWYIAFQNISIRKINPNYWLIWIIDPNYS